MLARWSSWLIFLFVMHSAQADPYFSGNPVSPYPPGCVTLPPAQMDLYGDNVARVWSGQLQLELAHKIHPTDDARNLGWAQVDLFRVGCAEPDRSVLLVEFRLPEEWVDPIYSRLVLPTFAFEGPGGMHYFPLELRPEPGFGSPRAEQQAFTKRAFGEYTGGWSDPRRFVWRYILDLGAAGGGLSYLGDDLSSYYNRFSGLYVFRGDVWADDPIAFIPVAATSAVLKVNPSLPLNGRLSGIWVEQGSADQGMLLSFSTPVPPGLQADKPEDSELVAFVSWFTFDAQGNPLWLTGTGRFLQGSDNVGITLVQVQDGEFLGARKAVRTVIGSARLRALSCNRLEFEYNLYGFGLEPDPALMRLQRIDALEVAGYPCRDYDARLASLSAAGD